MSSYPNLNIDPELLKLKIKHDDNKDKKFKTEKHDHKNILKSLKVHNEYLQKKYESSNKKKVLLKITEVLLRSWSAISTSTI